MGDFVVFLRTPYNYDRDAVSEATGVSCGEPSLAVQDAREECDINTIAARFGLTGELPESVRAPQYGDFTGINDYQSALHALMAAEQSFAAMPAPVRSRFDNDPQKFVDFCSDSANVAEMEKLGLLSPEIVAKREAAAKAAAEAAAARAAPPP